MIKAIGISETKVSVQLEFGFAVRILYETHIGGEADGDLDDGLCAPMLTLVYK